MDSQETGATGGGPPTTVGQAATRWHPDPATPPASAVRPIDDQRDPAARGQPDRRQPQDEWRAEPRAGHHSDQECARDEHDHHQDDQAPLPRVAQPG